jgi:hypothetical protein
MNKWLLVLLFAFIQTLSFAQRVRPEIDIDDDPLVYNEPSASTKLIIIGVVFAVLLIGAFISFIIYHPQERKKKKSIEEKWVYIVIQDFYSDYYDTKICRGDKCIILQYLSNNYVAVNMLDTSKYPKRYLSIPMANLELCHEDG